jgi:hypothetical protein
MVGAYYLFINYIFNIKKMDYFLIIIFWLFSFLSNLTNQKDHFIVNKKNYQLNWTCSN